MHKSRNNNVINEKFLLYYRNDAGHPSAKCMNKVCMSTMYGYWEYWYKE